MPSAISCPGRVIAGRLTESTTQLYDSDIVATILSKVAEVNDFRAANLANLAVAAALSEVAQNPQLLSSRYSEIIGDVARFLAASVKDRKLTGLQAEHLVTAITKGITANPQLFTIQQHKLAGVIIEMLVNVNSNHAEGLLNGAALSHVANSIISIVSARGLELLVGSTVNNLVGEVEAVLRRSLTEAAEQLGRRIDMSAASRVIVMVLEAWARGDVIAETFEASAFEIFFAELADRARLDLELTAHAIH